MKCHTRLTTRPNTTQTGRDENDKSNNGAVPVLGGLMFNAVSCRSTMDHNSGPSTLDFDLDRSGAVCLRCCLCTSSLLCLTAVTWPRPSLDYLLLGEQSLDTASVVRLPGQDHRWTTQVSSEKSHLKRPRDYRLGTWCPEHGGILQPVPPGVVADQAVHCADQARERVQTVVCVFVRPALTQTSAPLVSHTPPSNPHHKRAGTP